MCLISIAQLVERWTVEEGHMLLINPTRRTRVYLVLLFYLVSEDIVIFAYWVTHNILELNKQDLSLINGVLF